MMARPMLPSQQKLAEKLILISDRGVGMLTRIYNIKKACGDAKSKPTFLSEKSLESSIKYIVRRFPNIDVKGLQPINPICNEIIKSLSLYYYTFVDLLDFKDHVCELLTTMDACQVQMDITLNYELTKAYLDLVVMYVTLMILLSRVDDRKAVLGLFNAAHEMTHNQSDASFPRLGQMIIDYDPPLKKLSEEFVPHVKLLYNALMSLYPIYINRNLTADKWRSDQKLSLLSNPGNLLKPAQTDTMSCEFLPLDSMDRWIIFGFLLCHQALAQEQPARLWAGALESGWVVGLFRDEVLHIHSYIQTFFDGIKGCSKKASEVKDYYNQAVQKAPYRHRERRKFLRTSLKELGLILTDQPGLLGPKALLVFMALTWARDEVLWLLRHGDNPPQQKGKGKAAEDLVDRQLPELLFHMEELRMLVRKYSQVLQRYYVQFLSGFDAIALSHMMQNLQVCPEDESIILSSLCNTIGNLSVKQVEDNELLDLRPLRLDWFRLQAYTSVGKCQLVLSDNRELASLLDTIFFHTKMVDYLDEMLVETSDLSIFCFYSKLFEDQFHMCLEFPAQNRYIIAFPLICGHFQSCTHELCPEERHHIRERSLSVVNMFLDEMAKEAKNIITTICDEQCTLSDKLLPKHCAVLISQLVHRKKKEKGKKTTPELSKPGAESYRKTREELTTMDKLHMALTELCYAINYCSNLTVWEFTFAPREYLHQHLETRFARALVGMVMFNQDTSEIAKPSELLVSVRAYMNVLQTVENYVHIDITRVFNNALLQQTQQMDSHGEKTVAALYTQWYSEVLLRRVSAGNICFSMNQRAFVSLTPEGSLPFNAEEFSDTNELRALAELVGPYGMRLLNETLMWHIASQVQELKKLVAANKDVLLALRTNFDQPEVMKEQFKRLQHVDNVLQRMTIVGVILCFRQLAQAALVDVLEERIPFLLSSVLDFRQHAPAGVASNDPASLADQMTVNEMASAAGLTCKVDPTLVTALRNHKSDVDEGEHVLACLLMVLVAVSIPKLARNENSFYRASLEGHVNNIHCMAAAVNNIFGALFFICGQGDTEDRMKEFLALASSSLLRLGQEPDKEAVRNRESVYLLLDQIVQECPSLTMDLLESCFPYALIRNAYHAVYKTEQALATEVRSRISTISLEEPPMEVALEIPSDFISETDRQEATVEIPMEELKFEEELQKDSERLTEYDFKGILLTGKPREGYEPLESSQTQQQIPLETRKGDFIFVYGLKFSWIREAILWIVSVFTLGFPILLLLWYPQLNKRRYSSCSLSSASIVLVEDNHGQRALHRVQATTFRRPGSFIDQPIRIFTHHLMRFVREDENGFRRIKGLESGARTHATILDGASGLTKEEQDNLLVLYGSNRMDIEGKSYFSLLIKQLSMPIYIFQMFSILVWFFDEYLYYAACVVVVAAFTAFVGARQDKKQIDRMRTLVGPSNSGSIVVCRRDGVCEDTDVSRLVPGDVVQIPVSGCIMPCDALVLAGSCIVNEEVLTGESVPVTKSSPIHSNELFEPSIHRRHVLFRGTEIIQTRYYDQHRVTALVIRTGFASVKGEIIRSILYPKPIGFSFYEDCLKFVMALCVVAAIGMVYCAYLFISRGASWQTVLLRTLDIITIVAPPALPAALTAGTVFADSRLRKKGIFSVSSTNINVCGKIKVACFDKTGTMTEEGLQFWAVLPVDQTGYTRIPVWRPAADLPKKSPILVAMASCHTLTRIHEDLCGDPMDLCMFNTTGWELDEPGSDDTTRYDMLTPTVVRPPRSYQQSKEAEELLGAEICPTEMSEFEIPYEVGIMRTFPFSSRAQCMSVITRTLGAPRMVLYTKGAPEKIIKMCKKGSVTEEFIGLVKYYASTGYRVVALASRNLEAKFSWTKAQRVTREEVEMNLRLLGLVILQNSLKPETGPVIAQLHEARTRTVMITGDNLMTAVSVARDCGMVAPDKSVVLLTASLNENNLPGSVSLLPLYGPPPCKELTTWFRGPSLPFHLALDGDTWSVIYSHFPEILPSIITCGTVFARMAPEQKTQVVEELMAMDYVVAMVGDGANDCGALKVAHIGVSLSEAESSVAAPFTSHRSGIKCIIHLMQEGRCALTTSYCTFKYMSVYSIVQLITALTLYTQGAMMSNMEFLYVDLFITTTLAVVMGRAGPMNNLDVTRPVGSLMSYVIVVPILLQLVLCLVVQEASLFVLQLQPWFSPLNPADAEDDEGVVVCWETTVVYGVSCFQYIIIAMVYSKKSPFRKPGYTNVWLVIVIVALLMSSTVILAYPPEWLVEMLELLPRSDGRTYDGYLQNWFRVWILFLPALHFFGALLIEECIADTRWLKRFLHWLFRKKEYKNKYKKVDHNLYFSCRWTNELNQ